MTNNDLLRESIDHATNAAVSPPDVTELKRRGRRRSVVLRGGSAVGLVGVVAAASLAVTILPGGHGEQAVAASIRSQGPAITYVSTPGKVHFGDKTFTAEHSENLAMSAATRAGFVYIGDSRGEPDENGVPYLIDQSGKERAIGGHTNPDQKPDWVTSIAADSERRYAAWTSHADGELRVNLFDSRSERVIGRKAIDCSAVAAGEATCEHIRTVEDGVVYLTAWTASEQTFTVAWDPTLPEARQVYKATDPGTEVTAVGNKTVVVSGDGTVHGPDGSSLGDEWTIERLNAASIESEASGHVSADGKWRLSADDSGDLGVVNVRSGDEVGLDVADPLSYRFDDDGSILVIAGNGEQPGNIVDCDLPSGQCRTVVHGLEGNNAGFPSVDAF